MKYSCLALSILACCALSAEEDPNVALNCRLKSKSKSKTDSEHPFHQGEDCLPATYQPTYSYPADVKLGDSYGGFATASYLYWFTGQEGMDLATTSTFVTFTGGVVPPVTGTDVVFQDTGYSSGFKVGLGYHLNDYDNWIVRADYTWVRNHTTQTSTPPVTDSSGIVLITDDVLYFTSWFFQHSALSQPIAAEEISTSWHMNMDLLDVVTSRACYQGRSLILSPFGGLRAAFIRQNLRISADSVLNVAPPIEPIISHNKSNSWGIGPTGGIGAHWLLGRGFRLEGNMGASLLFTQYTTVSHTEDAITLGYPVTYSFTNYNCLRPMAEMDLGIGWLYYINDNFAMDLSASYDFNYFWGQNMMRTLNDMNIIGVNSASNNLYLHGLTITATFEF